jgi:hypothetical protein
MAQIHVWSRKGRKELGSRTGQQAAWNPANLRRSHLGCKSDRRELLEYLPQYFLEGRNAAGLQPPRATFRLPTQSNTITLQRNFDLCVPGKGIARPQSQLPHSCVCERSMYSQDRFTYFLAAE